MARIFEPNVEQETIYHDWVAQRPPRIREVATRFNTWTLYRMKSTGHRVLIHAFNEDMDESKVLLTVAVLGTYNAVAFDRLVYGVDPDDLEECELPAKDEVLGAMFSQEQVEENLDVIRVAARPDLWEMRANGKAYRKDN